jgi:phosphogluconate 2-dehydrogenase
MTKKIVLFSTIPDDLLAGLQSQFTVSLFTDPMGTDKTAFQTAIKDADGMIGANILTVNKSLLESAEHLKVLSTISVGYDNYDLDYINQRGIMLTNTPDVLTETTADLGFALMMAAARRLPELMNYIQQGHWQGSVPSPYFAQDIHGKSLGIIGFGRIGQALARRGHHGFGMNILYHSRQRKSEASAFNAQFCELDELLSNADFICVTVPLSAETRHLIGTREFNLMHPQTVFVNIARGPVVDEDALINALQTRRIFAAGLDVFAQEPLPMTSPLLKLPNVVLTPHIGSATQETRYIMAKLAIKNLVAGLTGTKPQNLVNNAVWH